MKRLKLTKNKTTIVDDEDYGLLSNQKWSFHHTGYAVCGTPQVSLHRFIMKAKKGEIIDHVNRNKLDNRKTNLRIVTRQQNNWNSCYQDGTHYRKDRNAWIVRMNILGKKVYIGYFKDKQEALDAYKKASIKHHGKISPYYAKN